MLSLSDYQVREELYKSANSLVYRADWKKNGQPVILKVLPQDYPSPERMARFKREYEIIRSLDLTGVVAAYELETNQQRWVMVLEDFGGESLTRLGVAGRFELVDFLELALAVTGILEQVHRRNVIHKDINPSNIIFNAATNQVKLTDFGIAAVLRRENPIIRNPNALEGTLAYISPEQTGRMNRAIDYRTDFYSLGATFYELLGGRPPFPAAEAMELVHAHLAKQPPSLLEVRPDIPPPLANIVSKLMAKNAEDRYQSSYGLMADLRECLQQWQATGRIDPFPLGRDDLSDRFQIPQKLYGREQEIETLLAAFERVSALPEKDGKGRAEMMLVSGYAGVGKSALVREIYKPITRRRGYFIAGKFDQFQGNIPYASIIQAFQSLMRQLLTESEAQIAAWREKLLAALGPNGQVIIDVIPEVELIVGQQPPAPHLGPAEAQNRFNLVFQKFVSVFTQKEHPLAVFLDDLQWADPASLDLIQLLMTNPDSPYLFMLGAYRDNEIGPTHPLRLTVDTLREMGVIVNQIALRPLGIAHVNQLIAETLSCPPQRSAPLARLARDKTNGNPFFLNQFLISLYEEGLLTFIPPPALPAGERTRKGGWRWEVAKIRRRAVTDNVVELMAGKIRRLPAQTQHVLQLAACIGNRFDLRTLAIVNEKTQAETASDLWKALKEGLAVPIGDAYKFLQINGQEPVDAVDRFLTYRFLHDRVQQAVYSLIPAEKKQETHLKIGRLMLKKRTAADREEKIFDIVNQLNIGLDLIEDSQERAQLARLNLTAGLKAKDSTAYKPALAYFKSGLDLLPPGRWADDYALTFALTIQQAECEYLVGNFDRAEDIFTAILEKAQTNLEKTKVYRTLIDLHTTKNKYHQAIREGVNGLALFGVHLSEQEEELQKMVGAEVVAFKTNLAQKKSIEALLDLPALSDPEKIAVTDLLIRLAAPSYFANRTLFALINLMMVNMAMDYGNSAVSSFGYATLAMILGARMGDYDAAFRFGQLALKVNEKFNNAELKGKINLLVGTFTNHWQNPLPTSITLLTDGFRAALDHGDLVYAAFCTSSLFRIYVSAGLQLDEFYAKAMTYFDFIRRVKFKDQMYNHLIAQRYTLILRGLTTDPTGFDDANFDEAAFVKEIETEGTHSTRHWYYTIKSQLLYLYEKYPAALEMARIAETMKAAPLGQTPLVEHYFYHALILAALYPTAPAAEQADYWRTLTDRQDQLKKWSDDCPHNFLHKYLLISAEMARVSNSDYQAPMTLYEQAIQAAQHQGFTQDEALAYELAAKFYAGRGFARIAEIYLAEARYAYVRWGARAKVQQLDRNHPQLWGGMAGGEKVEIDQAQTVVNAATPTKRYAGGLDLTTVMKASQAVMGEIVLDKLLTTLMKIVLQNAGAQRGFLILEKEGQTPREPAHWVIEAEAKSEAEVNTLQAIPVEAGQELSTAIVNYVARTREDLVLNDASREGRFTQDPYIVERQPKSILCTPLINQGKLTGLLYLENNLTTGAFTPQRVLLLNLLSSQAAISIENARLYETLEQSEEKYRTLFEDSRDTIFISTPDGRIVDVNPAGLDLFGYSWAEVMTMEARDFYARAEDRLRFRQAIENQDLVKDFEIKFRRKDGTEIDGLVTATVRRAEDGTILTYQGLIQDITERKQAEQEQMRLLKIERELTLAHEIQQSLLPPLKPDWPDVDVICYTTPAREVGGDFYSYRLFTPSQEQNEGETRYVLAVGDVSGKGVSAALLMATSLAQFEGSLSLDFTPVERLIYLDQSIGTYTKPRRQNCALCYVELEKASAASEPLRLRAVNAGCIPPYIKYATGQVEPVNVGGFALGQDLGSELGYEEISMTLTRGDLIILTSDGVVEAINAAGELFGFERLEEAIAGGPTHSPEAMLAHLLAEVAAFVKQAEPYDDLTMVIAQV